MSVKPGLGAADALRPPWLVVLPAIPGTTAPSCSGIGEKGAMNAEGDALSTAKDEGWPTELACTLMLRLKLPLDALLLLLLPVTLTDTGGVVL